MGDPRNVVLFMGTSDESETARRFLQQRHVRFSEVPPEVARTTSYPAPTLIVYGVAYEGLHAIKNAVTKDDNL